MQTRGLSPYELLFESFPHSPPANLSLPVVLSLRHSTKHHQARIYVFLISFGENSFVKLAISVCEQRTRLFGCFAISVFAFIYVRRVRNPPQFFHPIHTILFLHDSRSPTCPADLAFSFSLSFSLLSPSSQYTVSFSLLHSSSQLFIGLPCTRLLFRPLSFLLSSLTRAPLFLARFISARCQFEFGTRTTGQRVSTKNQFLNARLFRAEEPVCIFPSPLSLFLCASILYSTGC